jgi:EpsI family protein
MVMDLFQGRGPTSASRVLILTGCLLATAGVVERASTAPVAATGALSSIPMRLADWHGRAGEPFDDETLAVLGVDDYLTRWYAGADGTVAHVYVGYYRSQGEGDSIHSPRNCLPGTGWHPVSSGEATLATERGTVKVNRYVVQKGLDRQLVLYWYQGRGRTIANEYVNRLYMVTDAVWRGRSDAALVRVSAPVRTSIEATETRAVALAQTLHPLLERQLSK